MVSSSTWILSIKAVFISAGVLTIALLLKAFVPLTLDFSVSRAPLLWSYFLSWLKPPYLYFIFNGLIISIVASSRFHHKGHDEEDFNHSNQTVEIHRVPPPSKMISMDPHPAFDYEIKDRSGFGVMESAAVAYEEKREDEDEAKAFEVEEVKSVVVSGSVEDGRDEFVISRSTWNPPRRMDASEIPSEYLPSTEKPLVSTRFGHRKPAVKASPKGGRALRRVAKPKRHETMENTWKAITEGRAMPLTRHLKKSDTWENHARQVNVGPANPSLVKKSETFKDRTNYQLPTVTPSPVKLRKQSLSPDELNRRVEAFIRKFNGEKSETFKDRTNHQLPPVTPSPVKLRKEPSLSQDELNRRVEAFIRKFNEDMRLQRREPLNQNYSSKEKDEK